jgi:hypothetical protein
MVTGGLVFRACRGGKEKGEGGETSWAHICLLTACAPLRVVGRKKGASLHFVHADLTRMLPPNQIIFKAFTLRASQFQCPTAILGQRLGRLSVGTCVVG